MTRARGKSWLCRNGHPMFRRPKTGNWSCYLCNELNLQHAGEEKSVCHNGHRRLVGKDCKACRSYLNAPYLKKLDTDGSAECPKGHRLDHFDGSVVYLHGSRPSRRCRVCFEASNLKARQMAPGKSTAKMCAKGLHLKSEANTKVNTRGERQCRACWRTATDTGTLLRQYRRQQKEDLDPQHVDWVVVERLLERGTFEYMRRGNHTGPTDAERWVAYCTFVFNAGDKHPEDLYGEPGYEAMQLYQLSKWRQIGTDYNWKPLTLHDILAVLPTRKYREGRLLT